MTGISSIASAGRQKCPSVAAIRGSVRPTARNFAAPDF